MDRDSGALRNRKRFRFFIIRIQHSAFIFDSSPGQADDTVGLPGNGLIVSYHHYSELTLLVQGSQDFQYFLSGGLIEVSGGFIGQ